MSTSLTLKNASESGFVCGCIEEARSACTGEPFYGEHGGKRYCVLHFPGKEKTVPFKEAFQAKLENKDFHFRGVWFPDEISFVGAELGGVVNFNGAQFNAEANFSGATFNALADFSGAGFNAEANFSGATFNAKANFYLAKFSERAYFSGAIFSAEANFYLAKFSSANFDRATFTAEANFFDATFNERAYFILARFSAEADFFGATFSAQAYFSSVTFGDYVRFGGSESKSVFTDKSSLDLQFARIEKADHISFHTLTLRPQWFVNVDARKFDFTNVRWNWRHINEDLEGLKFTSVDARYVVRSLRGEVTSARRSEPHALLGIRMRPSQISGIFSA